MGPTNTEGNRPYPDGFIWDEAWRQRQRADAYACGLDELEKLLASGLHISRQDDEWWVLFKGEGIVSGPTLELLVLGLGERKSDV